MDAVTAFEDMPSDFDAVGFSAPAPARATFKQTCTKCAGTGRYNALSSRGNECFACHGSGVLEFKTSAAERQRSRELGAARRERNAEASWSSWAADNKATAEWIESRKDRFDFAGSMKEAVMRYGHLTERQLETVERLMAKDAARDAERAAAKASAAPAPAVAAESLVKIEAAFASAMERGVKNPKMRLDAFVFSPAKSTGKNPGAIYVKSAPSKAERADGAEPVYLGKVLNGAFLKVRECSVEQANAIAAAASDPEAAAIAYGRRTGACSICGRELTVGESIDRGIGPICAERMGW